MNQISSQVVTIRAKPSSQAIPWDMSTSVKNLMRLESGGATALTKDPDTTLLEEERE